MSGRQTRGLLLGPVLFLLLLLIPTPENMPPPALAVAALTVLMAIWWVSEAIPIAATALLPIVLLPLLGVMDAGQVTLAYGHHLIFLFMGGFLIAVTMEKWGLHRRIAMHIIRRVGFTPARIILGFMLATAFLSMWISNTATTMLMMTIALGVIRQTGGERGAMPAGQDRFGTALMLGIAYAASIGGVATLIGTPPNAIFAGIIEKNYGFSIGFADWMALGLPLSLSMLLFTWFYLTRIAYRSEQQSLSGGKEMIMRELTALGPISNEERWVLLVFILVAAAWILRGLLGSAVFSMVKDSTIAVSGALLLFLIPSRSVKGDSLLDWDTAVKIPWDIIILFGGGFALANAYKVSGLTLWIAHQLAILQGAGLLTVIAMIVLLVIFLTEVTSNTATATLLLPVMGALAVALNIHPYGPMIAATLAASFAFMLPVATPPNAIVFSSRQVTIPQMASAGIWLNIIGCLLITAVILLWLPVIWGLDLAGVPAHLSAAAKGG